MPRRRPQVPPAVGSGTVGTVLVGLLAGAAACGGPVPPTPVPVEEEASPPVPAYDVAAGLPPSLAVLALVPRTAAGLTVLDLDAARRELGVPDLTGAAPASDRDGFWARVRRQRLLPGPSRLTPSDEVLLRDYGFSSDDVDWEASWPGGPDEPESFVLSLRPDLPLDGVRRAVEAGAAGLGGAQVDAEQHLVHRGAVATGSESWGEVPGTAGLASEERVPAVRYTFSCLPQGDLLPATAPAARVEQVARLVDRADLEPLTAWSTALGRGRATVRLGEQRSDVLARAQLTTQLGGMYGGPLGDPLADPSTGRIAFDVDDPVEVLSAAGAAWALCGEEDG